MALFTGSAVALITPFTTNDAVDYDVLTKLIEFQIQGGTSAIVSCGTTGEPSTMTNEERMNVIKHTVQVVDGRIPVIAGTGGNCTKNVIADSQNAIALGADALLIVTPYYNKCTQDGLVAHYNAIADSVTKHIIVYNVPARTGVNILPSTLAKIALHPNIVAVKESSGSIAQVMEIARLCPDLDLYSGDDNQIVPILSMGGKGVISVLANIAPHIPSEIVARWNAGDIIGSRNLQLEANPLIAALFNEVNPIPIKMAAILRGFPVGSPRLPLTALSQINIEILRKQMQHWNLIK